MSQAKHRERKGQTTACFGWEERRGESLTLSCKSPWGKQLLWENKYDTDENESNSRMEKRDTLYQKHDICTTKQIKRFSKLVRTSLVWERISTEASVKSFERISRQMRSWPSLLHTPASVTGKWANSPQSVSGKCVCYSFSQQLLNTCHHQEQAAGERRNVMAFFKWTLPPLSRTIKLYSFELIPVISSLALSTLLAVLCSQSQIATGRGSIICAASAAGSDRTQGRYSGPELATCRFRALEAEMGTETQSWNKSTDTEQGAWPG